MIRQFNPAPAQALAEARTSRFIPESQYHGDKFSRTLEEAFGPYARLHVPPEPTPFGYTLAVAAAFLLAGLSWVLQQ